MDKNTYETYEFLPANTSEAEPEQFFVVQDDGTFLLNRQIQYVAQVQDVKEALEDVQPCTVYGVGVSSQQFFVDVDNSTELISVSDQFILPDTESGLYTNSYLLQPSSSTSTEQIKGDVEVDQFKQPTTQDVDIDIATHNSNQGNNFTEITLSDEQYQMLEQKGWILLESNDKIFVLNTLGLHDITTNDKLIQKLKSEIQNDTNSEIDTGGIKIENVASQYPNLMAQSFNQQDTVEFVIGSNEEQDDTIQNLQFIGNDKENSESVLNSVQPMDISADSDQGIQLKNSEIAIIKQESLKNTSSIKIKTKYNFKDIPEKIVLGKTVNGKRLVAKVVKSLINSNSIKITQPEVPEENVNDSAVAERLPDNEQYNNNTGISETEFISLIHQAVRSTDIKLDPDDVTSAHNVIGQLLKVPNLKSSLIGHNLVITKVKINKDEFGTIHNKSNVALITGRVSEKDDSNETFEHLPKLLQSIKSKSEEATSSENEHLECIDHAKEICTVFHVHITETKCTDSVVRVSVTLNKRQLSLNQMFDVKKRYPNKVFGCSACAALFKSEDALKDHQDNDCLEADEMLTMDTDKIDMVDAYAIIKTENNKLYSCTQCEAKFPKLFSCVRHVKTHLGLHQQKSDSNKDKNSSNEQGDDETQKKSTKEVFKCKMCRSTYFHPATLSKHIVARHIKVKTK